MCFPPVADDSQIHTGVFQVRFDERDVVARILGEKDARGAEMGSSRFLWPLLSGAGNPADRNRSLKRDLEGRTFSGLAS